MDFRRVAKFWEWPGIYSGYSRS